MSLPYKIFLAAVSCAAVTLCLGQTAPPAPAGAPAAATPSSIVRPALSQVQSVTAGLNISKWKASRQVRQMTQEDVNSIQRDLGGTLPSLLASADAATGSVPPTFAVYRNLDALYDVLLRVSQTADMAAPSDERSYLSGSLQQLEAARTALGDSILQTSQHHEAEIVALQSEVRVARTTPAVPRRENVIDDGPVAHTRRTRHRRMTHKKSEPSKSEPSKEAKPPASTSNKPSASASH